MATVRRLLSNDAALACQVVIDVKPAEERLGHRPDARFMSRFLSDDTNYLFGALHQEMPIGYALAYCLPRVDRPKSMLYLHDIAVHEDWRNRGMGRKLMTCVLDFCRLEKFTKLFLMTDHSNKPARGLYTGTGGTAVENQILFTYDIDESPG